MFPCTAARIQWIEWFRSIVVPFGNVALYLSYFVLQSTQLQMGIKDKDLHSYPPNEREHLVHISYLRSYKMLYHRITIDFDNSPIFVIVKTDAVLAIREAVVVEGKISASPKALSPKDQNNRELDVY